MALDVTIRITAETDGEFSAHETSILQALAGTAAQHTARAVYIQTDGTAEAVARRVNGEAPAEDAPAPVEEETPAKPVRKRASRAKAKPEPGEAPASTGPAVLEDFQEDADTEADTADEADLLGGGDEEAPAVPAYTVKDALDAATKVLREAGGRAKVSEVLALTKAAKVSALDGDDIAKFIAALEG